MANTGIERKKGRYGNEGSEWNTWGKRDDGENIHSITNAI